MNRYYLPAGFNLEKTLLGGQAFMWERKSNGFYYGIVGPRVIKVGFEHGHFLWQTYPRLDDFEFVKRYFRLEFDYQHMIDVITKDIYVQKALKTHAGLRLLHQDFHEVSIHFIISQNSNIPKIRRSLKYLYLNYGEQLIVDSYIFHLMPSFERLAKLSEGEFQQSSVGYRAPYLVDAINSFSKEDYTFLSIKQLKTEDMKLKLKKLKGVGDKVADCILIFGLAQDNVTPIDLWAKRILIELYNLDKNTSYDKMLYFMHDKFGLHTSWAGQFLFEWYRTVRNNESGLELKNALNRKK